MRSGGLVVSLALCGCGSADPSGSLVASSGSTGGGAQRATSSMVTTSGPGAQTHGAGAGAGAGDGSAGGDSGDASVASTGELARPDVPPEPPPGFVEVTAAAGLAMTMLDPVTAPGCALDDAATEEPGDFCWPERFTGAAAVADYDGDGHLDVFLTRADGLDRLFRSDGDATFSDVTATSGLSTSQDGGVTGSAAWVDVDRDGDLDLYVTRIGATAHQLWIQDSGVFSEQALERGAAVPSAFVHVGMGVGVGDYDLDGWPDLFVADWRPDDELGDVADHNRLLRGVGQGMFEDVSDSLPLDLGALAPVVDAKAGVYGFAPAFVDLDDDGWPELTLTADFGTSRLLWNQGDGSFVDETWARGVGTERNGMGSTFGDFDGDGDIDWFVSAIWADAFSTLGHRLYQNDGSGSFTDVAPILGIDDAGWGWGAAWWDYDLDSDLDLVMAAGWPNLGYGLDPLVVWENVPDGPWAQRASELGIEVAGDGRGVVPFDYDGDGDEDLLVLGNVAGPRLFRNDVATGHWLVVAVEGTTSNTQAIGARVRIRPAGAEVWTQVKTVVADTRLMGQGPGQLHFGVGAQQGAFEVEVYFPASGDLQHRDGVEVDTRLTVTEGLSPPG